MLKVTRHSTFVDSIINSHEEFQTFTSLVLLTLALPQTKLQSYNAPLNFGFVDKIMDGSWKKSYMSAAVHHGAPGVGFNS